LALIRFISYRLMVANYPFLVGCNMSDWNIAAKPQEERDKINVDLAASGVAYKERLNMPVIA
jgi:hypothetical protein